MDWLKMKFHTLAEWITACTPTQFGWVFTIGTLGLSFLIANFSYFVLDAFDKAHALPANPGMLIISLFLALWILVMIATATFIFGFGGKFIRYDIPSDRLDSLKSSNLISKANKRIWLIGLSLYPFASEGWIKTIEHKIKEGVMVKLLIYDPETEFAETRASSLPGKNKTLADDINESIKIFTDFKERIQTNHPTLTDKFEIRLYKGNASMSTFIVDNEMRVGLYINNLTGLTAPEIRIVNKGKQADIFSQIEGHFRTIWDTL